MTAPREGALGHGAALACGLVALVFATNIVSMAADETSREEITSLSAANSLISGQARRYDEQVRERLDYLATTNDEYVRVPFYSDVPHVLLMGDIRDNMDNYINYRLAQWFRKQSIVGYSGDDLEADPDAASTAATPGSASSAATSTESASSSS